MHIVSEWLRYFFFFLDTISILTPGTAPFASPCQAWNILATHWGWERIVRFTQRKGPFAVSHHTIQSFSPWIGNKLNAGMNNVLRLLVIDLSEKTLPFEKFDAKHGIPSKYFCGFLQFRNLINSLNFSKAFPKSTDSFLHGFATLKHHIKQSYPTVIDTVVCQYVQHWQNQKCMGEEPGNWVSGGDIVQCSGVSGKIFPCNRLTESRYRIPHRLQHTLQAFHTFYPGISPVLVMYKK